MAYRFEWEWAGEMNKIIDILYRIIRPLKESYQAGLVCRHYKNHTDDDICEMVQYVKKTGRLQPLNYPFIEKYNSYTCDIKKDENNGLFYAILGGG